MQCRHFSLRLSPQHLIEDEERLNTFLGQVQVRSVQAALAAPRAERWSVLVFFEAHEPPAAPAGRDEAPAPRPAAPELTEAERRVYERLREWRGERARAEGVPPYVVAHNAALRQIARACPAAATPDDLAAIRQFGPQKAARYGADILGVLRLAAEREDEALFADDLAR